MPTYKDSRYEVSFALDGPYAIDVGRSKFLHGPCVTRCANGDWITAYQDGLDDPGRGSVIRQKRSTDEGKTWIDEGIIFDECQDGFGARNPAFGQTGNGTIIMIVQRVGLRQLGQVSGENIMGSKMLMSSDHGKTYNCLGLVDPNSRRGHQGCSTHLVYHQGKFMMPAFHPTGLVLYISHDEGKTWPERIMLAPRDEFDEMPTYPTLASRSDGSLLFVAHLNKAVRCFRRISADQGQSWSPIEYYDDMPLRHPVLGYAGKTMICVGRNMDVWKPALCVSPDEGETWSDMIDLLPEHGPGGGYTALWPAENPDRMFITVSAEGKSFDSQDITGLFLHTVRFTPRTKQ